MGEHRKARQEELLAVVDPLGILAPSHLQRVCLKVRAGDVMVNADLSAPDAREEAFGLVGAGAGV